MARERLHTRSITLHGFLRDDGLYELEASLEDVKSYDSKRFPAEILPAGGSRSTGWASGWSSTPACGSMRSARR